jgi:aspartate/methionine/tyrosine aminotransferase
MNQYARPQGHKHLVEVLAKKYSKEFQRDINWAEEVAIGVGATETIYAALQAFIQSGDEVIIFEPAFDIYQAQVQMAGGKCRFVPLHVHTDAKGEVHFKLNEEELSKAFNERTKALIMNNPHNPTGKVFTHQELEVIARHVRQHPRVLVISDEVYEHIIFDGKKHVHIAMLDGMWEKTITISSAGKTFSVTGWKVGWAIGPRQLIKGIHLANNWVQFSVVMPLQEAVANMLVQAEQEYKGHSTFYDFVAKTYERKRDTLAAALKKVGIKPIIPHGGIFLYCNISSINMSKEFYDPSSSSSSLTKDWAFCRWLTISKGITAIPTTAFFCEANKQEGSEWVRFAFCKTDEAIAEAIQRLQNITQ